ncbi:hypothetical protein GCG21_11780 [Pseudactinotalea sp. HY160]|uniref:carbohydrate kinase family protein n=1 Tax=Pseudactinotalea sp. HY160 TaxID=2654490 RepID=UPI00128C9B01|nr:PfkB family carbohydrate kinase [Pseudactinotalea sp. HY160]MPV50672.1 hypothetical protein [Pseudactinotalea sp. HY160]
MDRSDVTLGHVVIDEVRLADGMLLPDTLGGAGAYAVLGQALVTPSPVLVSGIGEDFPESARRDLDRAGVDARGLVALDPHTPRTRIQYFDNGEREEAPAFGLEHFTRLDPRLSMLPDDVELSSIYLFDALNPPLFAGVSDLRRRTGCSVLWEIHAGACTRERLVEVRRQAAQVDILSINRTEALRLSGTDDLARAMATLRGIAPVIALRLGAEGAMAIYGDHILRAGPPAGPVVDPTGAGNAFSGAFVSSWARSDRDLDAALRRAMAASALTIRQFGPPPVDDALRREAAAVATSITVSTQQQNGFPL